jgi:hypothetical protein
MSLPIASEDEYLCAASASDLNSNVARSAEAVDAEFEALPRFGAIRRGRGRPGTRRASLSMRRKLKSRHFSQAAIADDSRAQQRRNLFISLIE